MFIDDFNRIKEKEIDAIQYNLSEVDTEAESFIKSQRKNRAKKKLFLEDDNVQFLKRSSKRIFLYNWVYNFILYFHICKHLKNNICTLLVLGKSIEATKGTKSISEKLPNLPKPPKCFTQPHVKKGKSVYLGFRLLYILFKNL